MKVVPFVASSAEEAVAMIRSELGPNAIVVNVKRVPASGIARLWQAPRIEVLACVPEDSNQGATQPLPAPPVASAPSTQSSTPGSILSRTGQAQSSPLDSEETSPEANGQFAFVREKLEEAGFQAEYAAKIAELARTALANGALRPGEGAEELVRVVLRQLWQRRTADWLVAEQHGTQIFIGPPGSGKTTILCKTLAQATLVQGRPTRVLRLDGDVANTAELLSVYCEILRVPVDRLLPEHPQAAPGETLFVDLPGLDPRQPGALDQLRSRLAAFPGAAIHLVLNGAYDARVLRAQAEAFAGVPVEDVILTHWDEDPRIGKAWNLLLGTNLKLGWLSGGQNIPGEPMRVTSASMVESANIWGSV